MSSTRKARSKREEPKKIGDLILAGAEKIGRKEATWLMSALTGQTNSELILNHQQLIPNASRLRFKKWVERRAKGEPLQYVAAVAGFYGRDFFVNKNVLIPRPETEVLVENSLRIGDALSASSKLEKLRVADIGTGSGAIGLTLALERPQWRVSAGDVSGAALRVAKKNAKALGAGLEFRKGSLLKPWHGEDLDLIVANLPYVDPKRDSVEKQVRDWEPHLALFPKARKQTAFQHVGVLLAQDLIEDYLKQPWREKTTVVLELSAKVARILEQHWSGKLAKTHRVERFGDMNQRKRFLVIEPLRAREIREV